MFINGFYILDYLFKFFVGGSNLPTYLPQETLFQTGALHY